MSRTRLISASAGSGKTYRLVQELLARLESPDDPVRPEAIVATTFTRKAAAELSQRVREGLLRQGRLEMALRIGGGRIGTVHSICETLLGEFAFELGISPEARVLEERDSEWLFGQALAESIDQDRSRRLHALARSLGQVDPRGRKDYRTTVKNLILAARSNAILPSALEVSERRSLETLFSVFPPPVGGDGTDLDTDLRGALESALATIDTAQDTTKTTRDYLDLVHQSLRKFRDGGRPPWSDWVNLSQKLPAKKSQVAADPVRDAASCHRSHPVLHRELREWVRAHFTMVRETMERYQTWKSQRRLVDFVDQEALGLELLSDPAIRKRLESEIDLVLVDEFQDTSPIQLALFLELSRIAAESIWVGDPKQSIFGFRGADQRLMKGVLTSSLYSPEDEVILDVSFRSRPALVDLVSELFSRAFAGDLDPAHVRLRPHRHEREDLPPAFQHWIITARNREASAQVLASGVYRMLSQGEGAIAIEDRDTGDLRTLDPGDIAVLCRTNDRCEAVAQALEARGIRAALATPGLLQTPEGVLLRACLLRLFDDSDSVATATVVSLTQDDPDPETWLSDRLAHLSAGAPSRDWKKDDPFLSRLESLRSLLVHLDVPELVERVLVDCGIHALVRRWDRSEVRRANLDSFRRLAHEYQERCEGFRLPASLSGFLAHLEDLEDAESDNQVEGTGCHAVNVVTYYRAKGLEWPVVVLDDLHKSKAGDPWVPAVMDDREVIEPANPLEGRWIRYWAWPYGGQSKGTGMDATLQESPVYRRVIQESLDEELRLLYVGMTRARDVLVVPGVRSRTEKAVNLTWLDRVLSDNQGPILRLPTSPGRHVIGIRDSKLGVPVEVHLLGPLEARYESWRADTWLVPPPGVRAHPRASLSPTDLPSLPSESVRVAGTLRLADPLELPSKGIDQMTLGTALHAFFAADDPDLGEGRRTSLLGRIFEGHSLELPFSPCAILAGSVALREHLQGVLGLPTILREWPLSRHLGDRVLTGIADVIARDDSRFAVIDHKSFVGDETAIDEFVRRHAAQLLAYAEVYGRGTGLACAGMYFHFPLTGVITEVEIQGDVALESLVELGDVSPRRGRPRSSPIM